MEVETFECTETITEPIEAAQEAIDLIAKLRLTGQQELIAPHRTEGSIVIAQRCPYREMTKDERFVYKLLCPSLVDIATYRASPMPLRVLQVVAHAQQTGMFSKIVVWDRESAAVQDPVLVGQVGKYDWSPDKVFILARWGDHLETFSTLLKHAIVARREQLKQRFASIAAKATSKRTMVDSWEDSEVMTASDSVD